MEEIENSDLERTLGKRKREEKKDYDIQISKKVKKKPKFFHHKKSSIFEQTKNFLENAKIEENIHSDEDIEKLEPIISAFEINDQKENGSENESEKGNIEMNIMCGVFEEKSSEKLISEVGGSEVVESSFQKNKEVEQSNLDLKVTSETTPLEAKRERETMKAFNIVLKSLGIPSVEAKKEIKYKK